MIEEYIRATHNIHAKWRQQMKAITKADGSEAFPVPTAWRCIPYIAEEVGEYLAAYYSSLDDAGAYTRRNDEKGNQVLAEVNHVVMMCSSFVLATGASLNDMIAKNGFGPKDWDEPKSSLPIWMYWQAGELLREWEAGSKNGIDFNLLRIWAYAAHSMRGMTYDEKVSIFAASLAERKQLVARKHQWPR